MSKSNVVQLSEIVKDHEHKQSTHVNWWMNHQPTTEVIQTHLHNMVNTYGQQAVQDVVNLLGLDKNIKKAG